MALELAEGIVLARRFRLERRLGEGGMGVVWSATNTMTGRKIALKMLRGDRAEDRSTRRRFLREGRAASAVQHPNVVEILDVVELEDGAPAIVMELLDGESLGARLRRERVLSVRTLAELIVPAISAIGTAHAHGVVHRDLKPDNIFLARGLEGAITVKVLDFGIAKMTAFEGEPQMTEGLTGTGALLGTPYYMSPEQLFADETIDYRADIWSLGIILYECLSGTRPVQGDNFAHIVRAIAMREIIPLARVSPETPAALAELVMRMLSVDKEDRPQSLREVREVLLGFSDVMGSTFGDPVLAPVRQKPSDDSSGDVSGLLRSDIEILREAKERAGEPTHQPSPQTLENAKTILENTSDGLGVSLPPRRSPVRKYLLLAVFGAAALALGVRFVHLGPQAPSSPPVPPTNVVMVTPARAPLPPPASADSPAPSAASPAAASSSSVASSASAPSASSVAHAVRVRAPQPSVAAPSPPPSRSPSPPASAPATGGLVEKPPF